MEMNTNLGNVIHARENEDRTLDQSMKDILSDKQVLARILKYTLEEFEHHDVEIIRHSIIDIPEVGKVPIEPGLTNTYDKITVLSEENHHAGEGVVYFDIKFAAATPKEKITIIINVEAQRTSNPVKLGYPIENRMVFYIARLISSQKNELFEHSDYGKIKKVKSIWICMDCDEDFIIRYPFEPEIHYGNPDRIYTGGLIEGIIIGIRSRDNKEDSKNELISMLEDFLKKESAKEKIERLKIRHGLKMTETLERSVDQMCNYSELIREQGEKKAYYGMVQKGRITLEEAAEELHVSISEIEKDMLRQGYHIPELV